MFCSKL